MNEAIVVMTHELELSINIESVKLRSTPKTFTKFLLVNTKLLTSGAL